MLTLVRRLWRDNRLLLIAFAVAAVLTLFFAVRTVAFYVYWAGHQNVAIEGWMTIGYVAHSYRLDPQDLQDALGFDPRQPNRHPLGRIARDMGVPLPDLIARVEAAIEAVREDMAQPGDDR
ncbi:MAG: hypothetical protein JJ913_16360 [Rhizobiaceae bacterium]|nr:hypothetical protein [Rhizobiaceae bacterium]